MVFSPVIVWKIRDTVAYFRMYVSNLADTVCQIQRKLPIPQTLSAEFSWL